MEEKTAQESTVFIFFQSRHEVNIPKQGEKESAFYEERKMAKV